MDHLQKVNITLMGNATGLQPGPTEPTTRITFGLGLNTAAHAEGKQAACMQKGLQ